MFFEVLVAHAQLVANPVHSAKVVVEESKRTYPKAALFLFLSVPVAALAQGSPFDSGFHAIQAP